MLETGCMCGFGFMLMDMGYGIMGTGGMDGFRIHPGMTIEMGGMNPGEMMGLGRMNSDIMMRMGRMGFGMHPDTMMVMGRMGGIDERREGVDNLGRNNSGEAM